MNVYAGPPRAITRVTLRLVPLTPIHIGDGQEWRPDEYVIEEPATAARRYDEYGEEIEAAAPTSRSMLCRFDQQAAMRGMSPVQRNRFAMALDRGKLAEAADALRAAGQRHVLERIPLSSASASALSEAMSDPLARTGAVKPFIRSGSRPYIPGSSIKGAFRTALASAALPRDRGAHHPWRHETAMAAALGLEANRTETDPLRFLSVSDALLPEGATLIDRAEVVKPGGAPASGSKGGGIQMHYERTRFLGESGDAPEFVVVLAVDERAASPVGVRCSHARFDASGLLRVAHNFHVKLFHAETKKFFAGQTTSLLRQRLSAHRGPGNEPPFTKEGWSPGFLLLRLGRFGHFESKSLEGVRRGHFPQAKNPKDKIRPPNAWGLSRTVIRDAEKNPIPFGWVIGWVVKEERLPC